MIINDRKDLDALPQLEQDAFKARLAAGINRWEWQGGDWVLIQDVSTIERFEFTIADFPDAPIPDKPTNNPDKDAKAQALEQTKANRASAYTQESDPIFFKAQRGEATMEEWQAKVDEIRTRYPYPESD